MKEGRVDAPASVEGDLSSPALRDSEDESSTRLSLSPLFTQPRLSLLPSPQRKRTLGALESRRKSGRTLQDPRLRTRLTCAARSRRSRCPNQLAARPQATGWLTQ